MKREVYFVYNARKGWFFGVADVLHKWWSPETYTCDLCKLTHGVAGMRKEMKIFLTGLGCQVHFYHLNDLPDSVADPLKIAGGAPAVLFYSNERWVPLISAAELKGQKGINELIMILQERMKDAA